MKGAAISGLAGASVGALKSIGALYIDQGSLEGFEKAALDGAIGGFSDGFMAGGLSFGAGLSFGVLAKNARGIQIGTTAKPQYGKVGIGYGNLRNFGNTLLSLQNQAGKSFFRIDVDVIHYLHYHFGLTKQAMKPHHYKWIYRVIGVIAGVK